MANLEFLEAYCPCSVEKQLRISRVSKPSAAGSMPGPPFLSSDGFYWSLQALWVRDQVSC